MSKIKRLQAAVREMLEDLNAVQGEKLWGMPGYNGQDIIGLEDYGLEEEDMK
ncbi:hypothetical protein [Corynebacterium stationis]|uniref:hypothetical protein n=1 Tax=Corynebacterium stationis TaxID=1705 RepID=UPI0028AFE26B|nr:hypothetical protein [Corynebacterium stationis]